MSWVGKATADRDFDGRCSLLELDIWLSLALNGDVAKSSNVCLAAAWDAVTATPKGANWREV